MVPLEIENRHIRKWNNVGITRPNCVALPSSISN